MELDRFIRALVHRWWIIALFVAAGIIGTSMYFARFGTATAAATVAVLEPAVTKGMTGQQAQLSFASVAESYTVAERVINRLGLKESVEAVKGSVSVKLSRSLITNVASPLYVVQVSDPDPKRAVLLADAIVQEARLVFAELNTLDPSQIDVAFRVEEQRLRGELEQARTALTTFEEKQGTRMLRTQIEAQRGLVSTLRQNARISEADMASSAAAKAELEKTFADAQAALTWLRELQPEYDRLSFEVAVAGGIYSQLASRGADVPPAQNDSRLLQARAGNARTQLDQRRSALTAFQRANGIGDLASEIAAQVGLVSDLRRANSESGGARQGELASEEARLNRLRTLQPEYDRLSFDVNVAAAVYTQMIGQANEAPTPSNLGAVQEQAGIARARLNEARSNLETFQKEKGIGDLGQQLATQTALVNDLRRQLAVSRASVVGFNEAIASENAELQRLLMLLPTYEDLSARVDQANAGLNQLQLRKLDALLGGVFAPAAQVKLLDAPRIQPNTLWTLVLYALGIALGAFGGLIAIYLWAYYNRSPQTEAEAAEIVELPVLARVPRRRA